MSKGLKGKRGLRAAAPSIQFTLMDLQLLRDGLSVLLERIGAQGARQPALVARIAQLMNLFDGPLDAGCKNDDRKERRSRV